MNTDELEALFDQHASRYDQQWEKMAPLNEALYLFLKIFFSDFPSQAHILCVGAGTGKELLFLAKQFPGWQFAVVEPSEAMLQVCRRSVTRAGFTSRCVFHHGYLETLEAEQKHDAATCFLVSHFIMDIQKRSLLFRQIAEQLKPEGLLISSDLAADTASPQYQDSLSLWLQVVSAANTTEEEKDKIKEMYKKDVALLPPDKLASLIGQSGFEAPVPFYQAGLIHAFLSRVQTC
ncbi:MAG: class I SAM-dependent methyltransferase [Sneathiella sp.]